MRGLTSEDDISTTEGVAAAASNPAEWVAVAEQAATNDESFIYPSVNT